MKKIFIGFENIASMITDYKMGFEAIGLRTLTAVYQSSPIQHTVVDYNFAELIKKMNLAVSQDTSHKDCNGFGKRLKWQVWERALSECDIFIFMWSSFQPDFSDYAELKKRGKKIVTFFVGSDIRWIPAAEQEFAKFKIYPPEFDDYHRKVPLSNKLMYLRTAEKYSDLISSHPEMSQLALRPYFHIGVPMWLEKFRENTNQRKIPKVIHAPSNRAVKGTNYVLDVFKILKFEGLEFETELIENLPNLEAVKKYEDADILVGQLFNTFGGRQEREALACGSIVLSGFRPDFAQDCINKNSKYYQKVKECPIVNVDPNSLYHELKKIILDYPRRIEIAKLGRAYVEKYHDVTKMVRWILELLEQDNAEPDFYPTFFRNGFTPESNEVSICNHYTEMVKECSWYKRHVMPGERCGLIFPDPSRSVSTSRSPRKAGAPFNLLYLAFLYAEEKQIFAKIEQQFRVIKELNPDSHCYIIGTNLRKIPMGRYDLNFINLTETKDNPSRQDYFRACEQIVLKLAPDIIYFRYPVFDYWTYEFVSKFSNVVFEHQTIAEYEFPPELAEIEKKFGPYVLGKAKGIVAVTEEILKYEQARSLVTKPGYFMANGIDNTLPMAKANYPSDEIHLFSTAYFSPWHGIDRLIEGLADYKEHAKIKLHLIGYGREIPRYQKMIKKYDLEKNVLLYGVLAQEQIGAIAEHCQIGVGALGVHRKGLTQSVALKNREYCLRGIPFIYAGEDVDFDSDLPFTKIFSANDDPISIEAVVAFAKQISQYPEIRVQERQYALDNLTWEKKIPGLVQFLRELAQKPAVDFSPTVVPKPVEYYIGKTNQAIEQQDTQLAEQISETAISEYRCQPYLWILRGNVLRRAGKYQEAIFALDRFIESPEALFELLYVYHLLNQPENAEKIKQDLVQKYPHWQERVMKLLIDTEEKPKLRITYLISSILGITGGNITLLNQVNALSERGHHLTIVTYTDKPQWIDIKARIIRVPQAQPMAPYVPASHAVISTYLTNTAELVNIDASVKIYYAQGDQYIFEDDTPSPNPQVEQQRRRMCRLSKASYLYPNVHFVPNSRNLADAVERAYGKKPDAILPVCTDQRIFRPLQKPVVGSKWRILIVGPDRRGSDLEPLSFKGIDNIRKGLEKLSKRFNNFTTIRMSNTEPDIFKDFPCEFYFCPSDELKTFLYGTAHILVYASHYDSCPRPPQEAMAAGTAVVSTATPGAMEYCRDKENCLLVPIKSPEAIADAVAHLIKDGSLRERLVKGGFATARNFPCEREWNELEALLYRFMEESGKTLEDTRIPPAKENSGLYQNIQSLIDAGQSREAIIALKRLLISYPDFALAHNDLGVLYVNSDKKEKALSHYEQAVQLQPENITFQKNLADFLYVESGRVEDALQIYVNILAADPEDVETLLITGHICVALKKLDDARHFYQRVLEIEPGNPDAGQNLKALENYVKSDKAIGSDSVPPGRDSKEEGCVENKRPAIFNSGADNYEYKASILISLDGIHKHIRDCVKSIQRHTSETHEIVFLDNGSIKSILKWVHRMVDDNLNYRLLEFDKKFCRAGSLNRSIKAARGEFVVLVHSDVIVAQGWLTDMLRCIDCDATIGIVGPMTNKAEGIQKDINAVYPARNHFESYAKKIRNQNRSRRVPVKNLSGICLMFRHELIDHIGEFDEKFSSEAVTVKDFCLRAVLKGYKNFVAADVYIHHLDKHKNGRNHSAMEQIRAEDKKIFQEKFNALAIGNPEGKRLQGLKLLEQADELNQRGQVDQAVDILLNGIGICPDDLRIYLALAEILIKAGRHQDALDTLNEMPSKEPTDAMYLNQKKMQEDSHLQIEFSDSIFLRNLEFRKLELCGYSEEGLENYKKAAEYADCILSLNPLSATALNLKGVVAYRQNNRQAAQEFFIKSFESDPGYGEAYTNLGALKWEQGHQEEALELYERGFTLDPTDLDIATSYHSALNALGEYKHAESIVRNVTAMHLHNKKISYMLVDVLIQQGKYDSAMPAIEAAIARFGVDDGILAAALKVRDLLGPEQVSKSRKRSAVSLCMIAKNEEHYLARCLASVKPIVDEMIVVDTGSADRTRDIAKVFGANVFDFDWAEDFAAARNFSISKASGGWIFIMDGDEVISPLDHGQFKKIVSTTPKVPVAFSILTRNYSTLANIVGWVPNDRQYSHEEAVTGWMPSVKVRLFYGKDQIWFEGAVHEMVDPVLKRKGIKIKRCSIPIHHYGRLNREKLDRKGEIYFEIGKKKLKEMGDDISATRELAIQATNLEKNEEAILLWQKFLALEPVGRMAAEAFINMATVYNRTGKYEEALSAAKQAMQHAPDLKEAIYNYALAELHLGNAEKTIAMLEDLLDKAPDYPPAQFIRAAAYCCGTKKEKGFESLRKLKATPIGSVLVFSFLELAKGLISARRIEYALRVLVAAIENEMVNQELLNLFGECIKLKQEGRLAGNANMQFAGSQFQETEYASAAR